MSWISFHCRVFLVPGSFGSHELSGLLPLLVEFSGFLLPVEFYFSSSNRIPCLVVDNSRSRIVAVGGVPMDVRSGGVVGNVPTGVRGGDFPLG